MPIGSPADRKGLTICDATSAAFAQNLDWAKLDATTFSWQKALGGEAAHGMLILSPRAVERLETFTPPWPMPKLFRLTQDGKLIEAIFEGETINTPSLICVEDYIDALNWGKSLGGLKALIARADANSKALSDWVERTPWVDFLAATPRSGRTPASVSKWSIRPSPRLPLRGQAAFAKSIENLLEKENVAYDIGAYRDAPPGLRIWCGATVETSDIEALTPWLDFAFAKTKARPRQGRLTPGGPDDRAAIEIAAGRWEDQVQEPQTELGLVTMFSPGRNGISAPVLASHRVNTSCRLSRRESVAPRVLISDALSPAAIAIFKERGVETDFQPGLGKDKEKLASVIGEFDGLAIRSATKVTAKLLERAAKLKVIGRAGIGVDNVDIPAATAKGIIVMNTPFGNSITTAEHAIAMMFALARQIPQADVSTQAGKWEKNRFMGVEITGKMLGLIGCGNIGSIVAERAIGLHMHVIAYDPYPLAGTRPRSRGRESRSRNSCSAAPISFPCTRR